MKSKIVLFGEFLLRLTPPAPQKILQASQLQMHWAGSEVIAVSLSTLGDSPLYVRCVPRNDLAKAGLGELKKYNVSTNEIWKENGRIGTYYYEAGSVARPGSAFNVLWYNYDHPVLREIVKTELKLFSTRPNNLSSVPTTLLC